MTRILAVDEDAATRSQLGTLFEQNHVLTLAEDLSSGLEALARHVPSCILANAQMPDGIPFELLERARAIDGGIPVIFLTTEETLSIAREALRRGAYGYLQKPLDPDAVRLVVEQALSNHALAQENHRLRAELEAAHEMRHRLIKTVTHDLQNILMGVQGFAQLAQMSDDAAEKDRNMEDVVGTTRVMREMMENIAIFSRLDRTELQTKGMDLAATIRDAAGSVPMPQHLSLERPDTAPQVLADPRQVKQVLMQLLSNAARYSPRPGAVRVTARAEGNEAVVTVEDSGIGIPPDMQAELGSPFYRAKRPDMAEIPGAGLGLAIVRNLVERHGGRLSIESERGKGTRVTFTLPLASQV